MAFQDARASYSHTRFERWGVKALLVAKFVPGLSTIAPRPWPVPRGCDSLPLCPSPPPNEASAARAAQLLTKHGVVRVRPLQGGLDAWAAAGYPVAVLERPGSMPEPPVRIPAEAIVARIDDFCGELRLCDFDTRRMGSYESRAASRDVL